MRTRVQIFWRQLRASLADCFSPPSVSLTLALVPLIILLQERYGSQEAFFRYVTSGDVPDVALLSRINLLGHVYYSSTCLVSYIIVPALFHRLVPPPVHTPLGLGAGRTAAALPFCLALVALTAPVAWAVGGASAVKNFYPFYRPSGAGGWLLYESVYFMQIFAAEFFFRGFLLFRLEHHFKGMAVLVAVIPYALAHIHKPLPEALGSVAAGVLLGALALTARSIWPGLLLHYAAALFVDLAAAAQSFPTR